MTLISSIESEYTKHHIMEIPTIMLPLQTGDKDSSTSLGNRTSAKSCTCIIPFDLTITLPTVIIPHFTGVTALIREVSAPGVRHGDHAGCPESAPSRHLSSAVT